MDYKIYSFLLLAVSLGFVHTLLGPDHYLPFIVLSKSKGWSLRKTLFITFGCGIGHVLSSVLIGFLGIGLGWAVGELVTIESYRGEIAGWLMLSIGILYFIWGLRQGIVGKIHHHSHENNHDISHNHNHLPTQSMTPWILFLIFVFGPCEPLIPVLMYPAVQKNIWMLIFVVLAFAASTLITMLSVVTIASKGLNLVKFNFLERWTHAFAGGSITIVAAGMVFFGL